MGIWEWKVEENELIWNDRMYELYGRERGKDINNFNLWANGLHPNDKEKALKDLDNALKGLKDFDTYFRVVHPSSKVLYIKSNALVIRVNEGRPKRMIGINRDITEYKTKELELHKAKEGSEKRASELKESQKIAKIGSWHLNAFTNEVSWTEELYKMYGFDPNLPVPPYTEHMKLFTPDSWEILSRELAKTREKGIPYELELEMVKKDSSKGWMWVKGEAVFDKDKKIIGLRGIAQDITERKEAEERLQRQNEELQRTNHELDNFVYRVSHDLRAPIASSLGLIDLMSSASDVDGMKELLFMQKKSMLKLDGFIQDILDYSRNTRMELEASPIDLEELARETYSQLSYIKGAEKIDFSIEVEGGNITYSDKMRLSFIFNNLLSNAIRFYDSNKELSYIKLKAAVDVNNVAISLLDNGIGIEEKHMDRIFDMFYRGTNQRNGSGLGLYIVKESVKKLGGEIKVESNHKVGTTINLTLPNMKLT